MKIAHTNTPIYVCFYYDHYFVFSKSYRLHVENVTIFSHLKFLHNDARHFEIHDKPIRLVDSVLSVFISHLVFKYITLLFVNLCNIGHNFYCRICVRFKISIVFVHPHSYWVCYHFVSPAPTLLLVSPSV